MNFKINHLVFKDSIKNALCTQRRFANFDCHPPTYKFVMCRHGQSEYNRLLTFCGWVDSELSGLGVEQSINAGRLLKKTGHEFDVAYTSQLSRAHQSLYFMLKESGQNNVKIVKNWRLNELHYGALTGMKIPEVEKRFGTARVWKWRRGFGRAPEPISSSHPDYKGIRNDRKYEKGPTEAEFPRGESLEHLMRRMIPFFKNTILTDIVAGKKVLIVAHNNTLRGILKYLGKKSEIDMLYWSVPNAVPFSYTIDHCSKPIKGSFQYISTIQCEGSKEAIEAEKERKRKLEEEIARNAAEKACKKTGKKVDEKSELIVDDKARRKIAKKSKRRHPEEVHKIRRPTLNYKKK